MNIKKILISLLVPAVAVTSTIAINVYSAHKSISNLCNLIWSGQSLKAIEQIMDIRDVNEYSAPIWIRPVLLALEADIELPLVVACKTGDMQVISMLLERGADPNKFLEGNWSPLEATFVDRKNNRLEIAKLLIKNGAEIDSAGSGQTALFRELRGLIYNIDWTEAEMDESMECISFLVENGAKCIDEQGNTIIHYLSCVSEVTIPEDVLYNYLDFASYQNERGQTPLMWAARKGNLDGVRRLLLCNVPVDILDYDGNTAIVYAKEMGHQEIVELLGKYS